MLSACTDSICGRHGFLAQGARDECPLVFLQLPVGSYSDARDGLRKVRIKQ